MAAREWHLEREQVPARAPTRGPRRRKAPDGDHAGGALGVLPIAGIGVLYERAVAANHSLADREVRRTQVAAATSPGTPLSSFAERHVHGASIRRPRLSGLSAKARTNGRFCGPPTAMHV